jgi:predicted Zn-dependent peptidase
MKKIIQILLLGQILMAATIDSLHVENQTIPFIKESDSRLPLVTMQLIFNVSGSIEDGEKPGLAKLSAKMLGEGTKTHGASKFADLLESKAIHISAHAGTETFVIELSCMKEYYNEALARLGELLVEPNLTKESLHNVKTKIIGSLKSKENDFDYIASKELKKLLFANTPLQNPQNGTIQTIQAITLEDVKEFIQTHLVQKRLIIALGGDIDSFSNEALSKTVALLPEGKAEKLPFFNASATPKEKIIQKETQQAYIYFGSPFYIKDEAQSYKAKVAAFILGSGGFGSRLMEVIRVKNGLAYSAYARVHNNKSNTYFSGYLQTKLDSAKKALQLTKETIETFVEKGATQAELEQTKKFLLGSEPLRNETMSQRLNRAFMEYYRGFQPGHYVEELQQIQALTLDELNNYIKEHTEITKLSVSIVTK